MAAAELARKSSRPSRCRSIDADGARDGLCRAIKTRLHETATWNPAAATSPRSRSPEEPGRVRKRENFAFEVLLEG